MSRRSKRSGLALHTGSFASVAIGAVIVAVLGVALMRTFRLELPFRVFLVQSGSMEPSIMTGDVVVTVRERQYAQRDVITFQEQSGRVVTHRVVSVAGSASAPVYTTKGDANPELDTDQVAPGQILGRVVWTLPRVGFLLSFGKSRAGILVLIVIPATLLVADELRRLRHTFSE